MSKTKAQISFNKRDEQYHVSIFTGKRREFGLDYRTHDQRDAERWATENAAKYTYTPMVSKTSSPVAGHTSPAQANVNMVGSAVSNRERTIAAGLKRTGITRVPDGVDRRAYLKMSPSEQASIRRILASDDADRRSHLRKVHGRAGKDSRGLRGMPDQVGPRGGRYYISKNGTKVYVK